MSSFYYSYYIKYMLYILWSKPVKENELYIASKHKILIIIPFLPMKKEAVVQ